MNCIKNEHIKIIMYKKWTYKKWNYKKLTYKKWTYKEWTYKKRTDPPAFIPLPSPPSFLSGNKFSFFSLLTFPSFLVHLPSLRSYLPSSPCYPSFLNNCASNSFFSKLSQDILFVIPPEVFFSSAFLSIWRHVSSQLSGLSPLPSWKMGGGGSPHKCGWAALTNVIFQL